MKIEPMIFNFGTVFGDFFSIFNRVCSVLRQNSSSFTFIDVKITIRFEIRF